jgi:hypothetical protein
VAGLVVDFMRANALSAFLSPASYWATMLIVLALTMNGIWWSFDVSGGTIVFAGVAGLFVNALSGKGD